MLKRGIFWFFALPRGAKRVISITTDVFLLSFAMWVAFSLRLDEPTEFNGPQLNTLAITVLTTIVVFIRLGLYRAVVRFMGYQMMASVFWGVTVSTIVLVIASFLLRSSLPRSVPLIYWAIAMVFTGVRHFRH